MDIHNTTTQVNYAPVQSSGSSAGGRLLVTLGVIAVVIVIKLSVFALLHMK